MSGRAILPLSVLREGPWRQGPSSLSQLLGVAKSTQCPVAYTHISLIFASAIAWPSPCVIASLVRTSVTGFRAHPNSLGPHLNQLYLQGPYFEIRSHSEVPGRHEFGGILHPCPFGSMEGRGGEWEPESIPDQGRKCKVPERKGKRRWTG